MTHWVKITLRCLILWAPSAAFAAPMPWGIAIHEGEGRCGAFWGGDEFVYYDLPEGYRDYYPDERADERDPERITTPLGTCDFEIYNEAPCCAQLGLTWVGDVGVRRGDDDEGACAISGLRSTGAPPLILLLLGIGVSARSARRQRR